ncbi:hypothetical protein AL714_15135 [Clostridium botulinum]|uniref:DNA cytosine methyltransferase n=1 Tax=Clostridium botulinum TaxID=1491 RepID=UPI00099C9636|nr:DNA cytosine methyltransferase [Clostridium botulinum]MCC5438776.1 DNA cytosine methyltransferase [Clostridium botulinum]NFR57566.1 DNA cytosine methyltransferase [Clostridium botulinum]OPD36175.1 hypothetical protein AL714_15135 [Clostridium botulinum]
MIKKRIMKKSQRGIYIQDKELIDTLFNAGKNFKYLIDIENHKLVIVPSNTKTNNTISRRKYKGAIKPVIDIRSKEAINIFKSNYLELKIDKNKITIEEYAKEKQLYCSKEEIVKKTNRIIQLSKKTILDNLNLVAGNEQLSFLDSIGSINITTSTNSSNINTTMLNSALSSSTLPLTVCSIFSGAGLMDKSFLNDFDIIFALDNDRAACETYEKNLGSHIIHEDITKISNNIPHATVLIGGSPCQGLSNSNRVSNYLDNPKNLLVREYIKAVKSSQPYIFVLENVPQIISAGKGKFLEEIKNELSDYEITSTVLNAVHFGVAQERRRAVIIGSKIGKINIFNPIKRFTNTVKNAFKGLTNKIANQLDYSKSKDIVKRRMSYIPMGGNVFDIPDQLRPRSTHSNSYVRLDLNKPSVTIVNPRKSVILHPTEDRIISVRECARLQGIDDDFIFYGNLAEKQQQVCNSIPLPMFRYIAKIIKKHINQYNVAFR